ncbi:MAG: bifunctional proline dehydrogenase/L-glutamate gamma-semialdehyde dehydrogenase [Actinomycetaceae bacterium]|nr:bifunctional proline dehydrogenase/L-glutamate gamma-semialdehyde dehydrogenase [Actinomycetaceae bacterium]
MNASTAHPDLRVIVDRAVATATRWAQASTKYPIDPAAKLLAGVLDDETGLDYTVSFVDGVIRPEDKSVASRHLEKIGSLNPHFLPWYLRTPALVGGKVSRLAPTLSVPAARKVFAALVGDLVVDVTDAKLGPAIARLRADGARLNVNLLGEAVLGDIEASKRLADTRRLLERPDIDYVSLKVSAVTGPHNPWGYEQVVNHAVEQLLPLYQYAATTGGKFINLDMEEYRDLHLTIDVFKKILDREELLGLEAGIVLQTYLPDALDAMKDLQDWSARRRARGGAAIKVRVVKGANLAMERVDALMHGWELATCESKQATDANYVRLLDWAMTPERIANIRLGVAGHNLFTVAAAWELAKERGVSEGIDIEMLSGMATQQAAAVREDVGTLLLYVPVVRPDEYDVAIAYLVRRLEENAADENFMASIFDIGTSSEALAKERGRFLAAIDQMVTQGESAVGPRRIQNRATESEEDIAAVVRSGDGWAFANTPDSDPSLPANRKWAAEIASRIPTSTLGNDTVEAARVGEEKDLSSLISSLYEGGATWARRSAAERAEILHRAGVELGRRRADLIEVAGSELGKGFDQADVEVSEAIDFAHYYSQQALALEEVDGAAFTPVRLTAVIPPWNFPIAIPAGGVLAALAAGSSVILKPAAVAARCGALVAECLWAAGVPKDALALVNLEERSLGTQLVTAKEVERVVLTGGASTAELFRSWDPTLRIMAETSGKNSIIITPSADLDLAVKDVVASAFGHAGQKCSACSLVILVGSVGFSRRVHDQLLDATRSLHVGWADDLSVQMGPLSTPPGDKLRRALTVLEPGQKWELTPRQLDDTGRLWSPGVRSGVAPGSEFHRTEYFGPVLGVMRVDTLEEAIAVQNDTDFGLTAGLHSLDGEEIATWLEKVEAGNVYINRGITGAIVRRQPFGGWKRSVVGEGAKAGGPNYLFGFGSFAPTPLSSAVAATPVAKPQLAALLDAARAELDAGAYRALQQCVASDEAAAANEFDGLHDPSQVGVERNYLRYVPTSATIRAGEHAPLVDILRVVSASVAVGQCEDTTEARRSLAGGGSVPVNLVLSSARPLPAGINEVLGRLGIIVITESRDAFLSRFAGSAHGLDERIRIIDEDGDALRTSVSGSIDVAVWDGPVTNAGRIEILPFVREQAISMTNHRFGNPTPLGRQVFGN